MSHAQSGLLHTHTLTFTLTLILTLAHAHALFLRAPRFSQLVLATACWFMDKYGAATWAASPFLVFYIVVIASICRRHSKFSGSFIDAESKKHWDWASPSQRGHPESVLPPRTTRLVAQGASYSQYRKSDIKHARALMANVLKLGENVRLLRAFSNDEHHELEIAERTRSLGDEEASGAFGTDGTEELAAIGETPNEDGRPMFTASDQVDRLHAGTRIVPGWADPSDLARRSRVERAVYESGPAPLGLAMPPPRTQFWAHGRPYWRPWLTCAARRARRVCLY
eukprot:CAMPEP_0205923182 /NCGR_PEP_ID=MMETSP1325-20131115/15771_1 /ASSEMBLY_ACC=CAM_ASM_000708 /TAXON_ID=236786 /ORGANISM="Florenciella sp., Strain RCC1007" /LENGTH=281 /DNA_ID=CAMNT_0053291349 /DNA_START=96 /DNA_END=939 /DNA_ORIENTATION=+